MTPEERLREMAERAAREAGLGAAPAAPAEPAPFSLADLAGPAPAPGPIVVESREPTTLLGTPIEPPPSTTPPLEERIARAEQARQRIRELARAQGVPIPEPRGLVGTRGQPAQPQDGAPPPPPTDPAGFSFTMTPGRGPSRAALQRVGVARQAAGEALDDYRGAGAAEIAAVGGRAQQAQDAGAELEAAYQQAVANDQAIDEGFAAEQDDYRAQIEERHSRIQGLMDRLERAQLDPQRFWKNMTTQGRITTALGLALGSISRMAGGTNTPLALINRAIEQDLDLQQKDLLRRHDVLGQQRGLLDTLHRQLGDAREAQIAARKLAWLRVQQQIEGLKARLGGDERAGELAQLQTQIGQRLARFDLELAQEALKNAMRDARGARPAPAIRLPDGTVLPVRSQDVPRLLEQMREAGAIDPGNTQWITDQVQQTSLSGLTHAVASVHEQLREAGAEPLEPQWLRNRLPGFIRGLWGTPAERRLRQALMFAGRAYVYSVSGKGTNEREAEELKRTLEGEFGSPEEMVYGVRLLTEGTRMIWDHIYGGADPRAWQEWTRRVGGDPRDALGEVPGLPQQAAPSFEAVGR